MTTPLVSIAVPVYDSGETLGWALASLVAQSVADWEALIVDDGSSDPPDRIVAAFADPRLRLLRHPRNLGRAAARQTALDAARGDYLAMLDADDFWYPDKLAIQLAMFARDPALVLTSSPMTMLARDGSPLGLRALPPAAGQVDCAGRAGRCPLPPHAPSLIAIAPARAAGYRPDLRRAEDFDFLRRLLVDGRWAPVASPLYAYAEARGLSHRKIAEAHRWHRQALAGLTPRAAGDRRRAIAASAVRQGGAHLARALLGDEAFARRQLAPLPAEERRRFARATDAIRAHLPPGLTPPAGWTIAPADPQEPA